MSERDDYEPDVDFWVDDANATGERAADPQGATFSISRVVSA